MLLSREIYTTTFFGCGGFGLKYVTNKGISSQIVLLFLSSGTNSSSKRLSAPPHIHTRIHRRSHPEYVSLIQDWLLQLLISQFHSTEMIWPWKVNFDFCLEHLKVKTEYVFIDHNRGWRGDAAYKSPHTKCVHEVDFIV